MNLKSVFQSRIIEKAKKNANSVIFSVFRFAFLFLLGYIVLYPLLYMVSTSIKTESDFLDVSHQWIPIQYTIENFKVAFSALDFFNSLKKTLFIQVLSAVIEIFVCSFIAYGFARFDFPLKRLFYALFMGTMFMPAIVTIMPMYLMWSRLGVLDTYIPLTMPALFAAEGSFVFMLIQFLKGVPKEFDEAARIDGCNSMQILVYILVPCIRPVIVSICVFIFLWTMNDFLTPLIMISSVEKYPISLILRLSADSTGNGYEQCKILAMSVIGLIPSIAVFGLAQKKFLSGITAGGLSG
jgi:oligogalacturonide transport system permease protein